jgi:hypothetical protein
VSFLSDFINPKVKTPPPPPPPNYKALGIAGGVVGFLVTAFFLFRKGG